MQSSPEDAATLESGPRPTSGEEQARAARQVLAGAFHGVLSTWSRELEGYPFGSVVPYVLGGDGLPLLLLSRLSQHTKNLDADGRCGLTVMEAAEGDVQQRGRLSAIGDVSPCGPDADTERYFRYMPHARMYFERLDFQFYRFMPKRFHWNGGFATARWLSVDRIVRTNPFAGEVEARIIAHMNQDHTDALRTYLVNADIAVGNTDVTMLGIDAEGIDLRTGDRLHRVPLPRPTASAAEARARLIEMASKRP